MLARRLPQIILQYLPGTILLFIPLFFSSKTVDYFAFNKFYLLNLIASLGILSWAIKNLIQNKISLTLSPALKGLFFVTLVHIVSALVMSPTRVLSLTGITTLFAALFFIHLAFTSIKVNTQLLKNTIYLLLLSSILLSLFTILQYFDLGKLVLPAEFLTSKYFNLTGGIIPALTFTIPLIIGLLPLIYLETNLTKKIIYFSISAVLATATIINISLILPKDSSSPVTLLPLRSSWAISLDIFKYPATAFIGTGPENFLSSFTRLRPVYLNLDPKIWNTRFSESGSFFLSLLTTTGLLGGLAFLSIFGKKIIVSLKHFKENQHKPEVYFLNLALLGYVVAIFFTPAGIVTIVTTIVLLSVLTQYLKNEEHSSIKTLHLNISDDGIQNRTLSHFLPIATLILVATIVLLYWNFGAKFYTASKLLREANSTISTNLNESFQKQVRTLDLNPYDSTYPIILSQTYQQAALFYLQKTAPTELDQRNAIETMQRSIDSARQAARLDPFNVLVWENLSNIYQSFIGSADGATNLAISHLAQAISLDPTNPKLRLQLGILYYNLQDQEQAIKLINQAVELKPDWDLPYQNLYRVYLEKKELERAKLYLQEALKYTPNGSETSQKLQEELINLNQQIGK